MWYITAFDRSWMSICVTSVNNPFQIVFLDQGFGFVYIKLSGRCGQRQLSWILFLYWYCAHCHEQHPRAVWSTLTVRYNCSLQRLLSSSGSQYKLAKFPIQFIWNVFATDSFSNLKKHCHQVNLNGVKSTYDLFDCCYFALSIKIGKAAIFTTCQKYRNAIKSQPIEHILWKHEHWTLIDWLIDWIVYLFKEGQLRSSSLFQWGPD